MTITIRGHYKNQTFIPDQPLPTGEGRAELTIETDLASLIPNPRPTPTFSSVANPSREEFEKFLKEFPMEGLPPLPPDFSPSDLYDEE